MSLTDQIQSALKTNIEYGAGRFTSADGILDLTWLPDEGVGYVDIKNPGDKLGFKDLKKKSLEYIDQLPEGVWEFNPDTPQKGRIYGKMFEGVAEANPDMPNNALKFVKKKATKLPIKTLRALGVASIVTGEAMKAADAAVLTHSVNQFRKNPTFDSGVQVTLDAIGVNPEPVTSTVANVAGLGWSNKDWIARNIGQAVEGIKEKASYINPDHPGPPPEIPQAVVNRNGMVELIKQFEGFRSDAYHHTGDVPTIGYGNTQYLDGTPVKLGDTISESDADALMGQTVDKFWGKLKENPHIKKLPPNAQAAIGSFAYNVGPDFFDHPGFTTITKAIKGGDLNKIGEAMQLYVNPGTQFEDGLRRRREAERQLLLKP